MARHTYDDAVALVHPLYYDFDLPEAYSYAAAQYLFGEALMAAPITATQVNYSGGGGGGGGGGCAVGKPLGCFDDHRPKIEPRITSGNDMTLTLAKCAALCRGPEKYMAIDSAGAGLGSQCYCGSQPPPASRSLPSTRCNAGCSGNESEPCGGVWAASVYELTCSPVPPPPPPPLSPPKDIWIPPGKWFPWMTSDPTASAITGPTVLSGRQFALDAIPLFAKAGAVVPTQTMQKAEGPLVWVIFPGNGTGRHCEHGLSPNYHYLLFFRGGPASQTVFKPQLKLDYVAMLVGSISNRYPPPSTVASCRLFRLRLLLKDVDDGTTTQYQASSGASFSWTTLSHTTITDGNTTLEHTVTVIGQPAMSPPRRQVLQVRRLAEDLALPSAIECNGSPLSRIPVPPSTMGLAAGWWVAPKSADSLWVAGGSLMISLPLSTADASVVVLY